MGIIQKRGERMSASRKRNYRGAVVPRPFPIPSHHSGGVTSPVFPLKIDVQEKRTFPDTTGGAGGGGVERSLDIYKLIWANPNSLDHPAVSMVSVAPQQTVKQPTSLSDGYLNWASSADRKVYGPHDGTSTATETRRVWGLNQALAANTVGGYTRLVCCAWDHSLQLTLPPRRVEIARDVMGTTSAPANVQGIKTTGVNVSPFYIIANTHWHEFGGLAAGGARAGYEPLLEALCQGTGTWDGEGADMDDLVNARGLQVWKVYPGTKTQDLKFTVSCHDTRSWFKIHNADHGDDADVGNSAYDSYREMARTDETLDGPGSWFSEYTMEIAWYVVVPREYDYTAFFDGLAEGGADDTTDARIDVKEIQGTFKVTSHQKWLFYEKEEVEPDDVNGL